MGKPSRGGFRFSCNPARPWQLLLPPEEVAAGTVRALRAEEVLGRGELRKEPDWEVLSSWWGRLCWSLGLPGFMALPSGPQEAPRYLLRRP